MRRYTPDARFLTEHGEPRGAGGVVHVRLQLRAPHRPLTRRGGPPTMPAMAAGVSDLRMRMEDVVAMLDTEYEAKRAA